MEHFKDKLKTVKAFAFDVDGVFSENVILDPSGELLRTMNIKDGYAVQLAVKRGYPVAIITGGNSQAIKMRFENLGVKDVYLKSQYKTDDFNEFLLRHELSAEQVLYMGDDIPDIEVLKMVGISTCPADAVEEVKAVCMYISPREAGKGCVRDVIEQVLKVNQVWMDTKTVSIG
ncbi:MAG TPA: HAD hydrolase family protein [Bacteroidales bacterium]|nr:HAD hydrolase family protein [Bacteroidales bacterium]